MEKCKTCKYGNGKGDCESGMNKNATVEVKCTIKMDISYRDCDTEKDVLDELYSLSKDAFGCDLSYECQTTIEDVKILKFGKAEKR